jgi:hypothetical protein
MSDPLVTVGSSHDTRPNNAGLPKRLWIRLRYFDLPIRTRQTAGPCS